MIKSANHFMHMPLSEIVFKVSHDCPFSNISRKFPSLQMFSWCNRDHDVFELIVEEQEAYSSVMEEISKFDGIIETSSDDHTVHLVTTNCSCNKENSVNINIDAFNLLLVPPMIYEQGWEYYRVIAFRHEDWQGLLHRLQELGFVVELLRKVPFDGFIASSLTLTADALFSNVTEKQMDALLTAYSHGYYRLPRKADVQTIASKKRVPRTTFQEHLKKAENKLITSLVPYINLFKHAPAEKRIRLKVM